MKVQFLTIKKMQVLFFFFQKRKGREMFLLGCEGNCEMQRKGMRVVAIHCVNER